MYTYVKYVKYIKIFNIFNLKRLIFINDRYNTETTLDAHASETRLTTHIVTKTKT